MFLGVKNWLALQLAIDTVVLLMLPQVHFLLEAVKAARAVVGPVIPVFTAVGDEVGALAECPPAYVTHMGFLSWYTNTGFWLQSMSKLWMFKRLYSQGLKDNLLNFTEEEFILKLFNTFNSFTSYTNILNVKLADILRHMFQFTSLKHLMGCENWFGAFLIKGGLWYVCLTLNPFSLTLR